MWIFAAAACIGGGDRDTSTDTSSTTEPGPGAASIQITVEGDTYGLEPIGGGGYAVGEGEIAWFEATGQQGLLALGLAFYLQSAGPLVPADYPLGGWGALPEASLVSFIVADADAGVNTTWAAEEEQASDGAVTVDEVDPEAGTMSFSWTGTFGRSVQVGGGTNAPDGSSFLEGHAVAVPISLSR